MFLAVRGAAFRGCVLPVLSSPGGRHWDSVAAKRRGHGLYGRPSWEGAGPASRSTLQAPTARGAEPGRPGQRPHMPFLGRRREPCGGGWPRAAVQVTSDPPSPPAPVGPVHQPPTPTPPRALLGRGTPAPQGLALLSPGPSGLCCPGSSLAMPTAHTAAVRGGDSLGLVVWLSFGWRGQPSSRRFCHAALPGEAHLFHPPAPVVLEGGSL